MAQLDEALRYKQEGRRFDSRHNLSRRTMALWSTQPLTEPGIFPGGKGDRCVGLTTLTLSCADCPEIWEPQPPVTFRACSGL